MLSLFAVLVVLAYLTAIGLWFSGAGLLVSIAAFFVVGLTLPALLVLREAWRTWR